MSQEPVRVSPLIKLFRYSFLIGGIIYGAVRRHRFAKQEAQLREVEAREKIIRDAKLAQEKKRLSEREARAIALLSK